MKDFGCEAHVEKWKVTRFKKSNPLYLSKKLYFNLSRTSQTTAV